MRHMIRRLDPRHWDTPRLLVAVLGLVIGLQVAWIVTGRFGAHEASSLETPAAAIETLTTPERPVTTGALETIRRAALFGATATADPNTVNPTSLNLQLAGVLAERDPAQGQALIGEAGAAVKVYAVGAALPAGATLKAVYPDRVLLDRGGVIESLALPKRSLSTLTTAPTPAPASSTLPSSSSPPGDLGALLRWQVVVRPGQSAGLRVYPGNDARIFEGLGLRAGDLVLAINDVPLDDPANAEQFLRTLSGSPESTLIIERDGREERLSVNLTRALSAPLT